MSDSVPSSEDFIEEIQSSDRFAERVEEIAEHFHEDAYKDDRIPEIKASFRETEDERPPLHDQEWTTEDVSVLMASTDRVEIAYRRTGRAIGYVTVDEDRFEMAVLPERRGTGIAVEVALLALRAYFRRPNAASSVYTKIHRRNRRSLRSARHLGWTVVDPATGTETGPDWHRLRFHESRMWDPLPRSLMRRFHIA